MGTTGRVQNGGVTTQVVLRTRTPHTQHTHRVEGSGIPSINPSGLHLHGIQGIIKEIPILVSLGMQIRRIILIILNSGVKIPEIPRVGAKGPKGRGKGREKGREKVTGRGIIPYHHQWEVGGEHQHGYCHLIHDPPLNRGARAMWIGDWVVWAVLPRKEISLT